MLTPEKFNQLDPFTRGYLECALFTNEPDELVESGAYHQKPEWNATMFSPEALREAEADCLAFYTLYKPQFIALEDDLEMEDMGRLLWYDRNGHGVGYWSEDLGDVGDVLSAAADAIGTCDLYSGDDGKLYFSR